MDPWSSVFIAKGLTCVRLGFISNIKMLPVIQIYKVC